MTASSRVSIRCSMSSRFAPQSGVSRIELVGLGDAEVVALMEAMAGYALDEAGTNLAHAVYLETDGNPFFVNEVLRHLAEIGAIYQDETGRWTARIPLIGSTLPDSVREVIGARRRPTRPMRDGCWR